MVKLGPSKKSRKERGEKLKKLPKAKGKGKGSMTITTAMEPSSNTTAAPSRSSFDAFTGVPTAAR
jgi:hypothetical protein